MINESNSEGDNSDEQKAVITTKREVFSKQMRQERMRDKE